MKRTIEILPDKASLIQRSLDLILEKLHSAILDRDRFTIALSGGSTPQPLYKALAQQDLPWNKIQVLWGDERYVPPNHPDSNAGMARAAWLNHVPIPAENIYPMPTNEADPVVAAQKYEQALQGLFQTQPGVFPPIDVILLGMGDDGHTASLFPHTDALRVTDRLITVGNKDGQPRITFTAPLINQARCVVFVVAGASKQPALSQVFADTADERLYPSRLIQPAGELWWLLDQSAGEHLGSLASSN